MSEARPNRTERLGAGQKLRTVPMVRRSRDPADTSANAGGLADPLSDPIGSIPDIGRVIWQYPGASSKVDFGGGAVVVSARLVLLFWGSAWQTAQNPSATDVHSAVGDILSSPYLSEVQQYGFQSLTFEKPLIVISPAPPAPTFSASDAKDMVWSLIDDSRFPEPDEPSGRIIYMIFAPPGSTYEDASSAGAHGQAWDFDFPADVDYAWVGWCNFGDLDFITETFTHELVEILTDPEPAVGPSGIIEPGGYTMSALPDPNNEIVDFCFNQTGIVEGHTVSAYYSDRLRSCVVPAEVDHRTMTLAVDDAPLDPKFGLRGVGSTIDIGSATAPDGDRCFNGAYSWFSLEQSRRYTVTATANGFMDPVFTWQVQGQEIFMSQSLDTDVVQIQSSSDTTADPLSLISPIQSKTVTSAVSASGNVLRIDSTIFSPEASFNVKCTVKDGKLPPGFKSERSQEIDVSVTGEIRVMDKRFQSDLDRCVQFHDNEARRIIKNIEFPVPDPDGIRPVWVEELTAVATDRPEVVQRLESSAKLVEDVQPHLARRLRHLASGLEAQIRAGTRVQH